MSRTIIVGDVHGCADELERLLRLARFEPGRDRLYSVGDLVARGPATRRVLRLFREVGAGAVLGNHEVRLLEARTARREGGVGPRLGASHQRLVESLGEEEWRYLESLPLQLEVTGHGPLPLRVVHAGVDPTRSLDDQDPWVLTHVRSIGPEGKPSARFSEALWALRYRGPVHIVFGHNAMASVQLHDHATGLDSGCVYGHELTALVLAEGEAPAPAERRDRQLLRVPAEQTYYPVGE